MNKKLLYIILTVVLLVALFLFIKGSAKSPTLTPSNSIQEASSSPQITAANNAFELVVKGKKLVSGPETIQVKKGDNVTIKITVDEDEEFHIHGYDKSIELTKDQPGELHFVADQTGRFEYELEISKTDIGALEVTP